MAKVAPKKQERQVLTGGQDEAADYLARVMLNCAEKRTYCHRCQKSFVDLAAHRSKCKRGLTPAYGGLDGEGGEEVNAREDEEPGSKRTRLPAEPELELVDDSALEVVDDFALL